MRTDVARILSSSPWLGQILPKDSIVEKSADIIIVAASRRVALHDAAICQSDHVGPD